MSYPWFYLGLGSEAMGLGEKGGTAYSLLCTNMHKIWRYSSFSILALLALVAHVLFSGNSFRTLKGSDEIWNRLYGILAIWTKWPFSLTISCFDVLISLTLFYTCGLEIGGRAACSGRGGGGGSLMTHSAGSVTNQKKAFKYVMASKPYMYTWYFKQVMASLPYINIYLF